MNTKAYTLVQQYVKKEDIYDKQTIAFNPSWLPAALEQPADTGKANKKTDQNSYT